ncbi:MAG TPA: hypothetical protein VKY59_12440 [Spirillospora sp.]|jgi:hypothetical protein|nr:hypothetical protein [Spirillospora sp.]
MSNPNLSDVQLQNLLTALTDDLLAQNGDVNSLAERYQISSAEVHSLLELIGQMNQAFVPVQPSERFVRRLHQDLMGSESSNVLVRVRKLPPRVQLAAGLALMAGFVFLSRRRAHHVAHDEQPQEAMSAR